MRAVLPFIATALLGAAAAYATVPTPTDKRWNTDLSSQFVTAKNGQFFVNGSEFRFIGTNAYWLPYLNTDEDIDFTLGNMSAAGISVVRTWAFNDVTSIPENGTWLQLIANGTATINNGTNGLQRLDKVVELAAKHGIYVLFSLTNNWNPLFNETNSTTTPTVARRDDAPITTATPLPRNFLSNSYGGMDAYVREFGQDKLHSEFYTNMTIRAFFQNYTQAVVSRFANNPRVLSWELANDPRCNSSVPTSDTCNTNTVTQWHADVSTFVRSVDPNHMVSTGDQGFTCVNCPKLFFKQPAPAPVPSGAARKRSPARAMSKARLMQKVIEDRRRSSTSVPADGVKIRGRWSASSMAKRQSSGSLGQAFDGSTGVDSQDILSAPDIGFGSLQYFPDQNSYGTNGQAPFQAPSVNFNDTIQQGIDWIQLQAANAQSIGKPIALTGFGLVTQDNLPFFVPFNSTVPVQNTAANNGTTTNASPSPDATGSPGTLGVTGVTDDQRDQAYSAWLNAGINAGLTGLIQYQWSSPNLTSVNGTLVQAQINATTGTVGQSPNDGYGTLGYGLIAWPSGCRD
ncbi:glycoside hydrolase superfamily [Amylostereum chailletii]|nr:glycoside hydrolase superfamily [Amylostereum chailletii]